MGWIERTYRKKELIQALITQEFVTKIDYISKWFSVKEVSTEVLQEEEKIIFSAGMIVTKERKLYVNCVPTNFIHWVTDYKNNISMTYFSDGREEKSKYPPLRPKNDKIIREWLNGETCHEYYNDNRDLLSNRIYDANNKLKGDITYIYDNNNLLIKVLSMGEYGKSKSEVTYQYNTQGKLICRIEKDSNNVIKKTTTYNYNNQGLYIQTIENFSGKQYINKYEYDDNGNLLSSNFYDENYILRHGVYRYNQYGDTTYFDTWRNGERVKEEYEYDKYDKYGNWLECREQKDGKTVKFIRRQFKYKD